MALSASTPVVRAVGVHPSASAARVGCVTHYLVTTVLPLQVCGEQHRFEKLMEYFRNEDSNIDFMVSVELGEGGAGGGELRIGWALLHAGSS